MKLAHYILLFAFFTNSSRATDATENDPLFGKLPDEALCIILRFAGGADCLPGFTHSAKRYWLLGQSPQSKKDPRQIIDIEPISNLELNTEWVREFNTMTGFDQGAEARNNNGQKITAGYAWGYIIVKKTCENVISRLTCDRGYNVAFSPDMKKLCAGGYSEACLFTPHGLKKSFLLKELFDKKNGFNESHWTHVAFSFDGKILAIESNKNLAFVNMNNLEVVYKTKISHRQYQGDAFSGLLSFSKDGDYLKVVTHIKYNNLGFITYKIKYGQDSNNSIKGIQITKDLMANNIGL